MPAKVAKVKNFERDGVEENVIIDPGGGANRTAEHTAPSGVDAPPLPGDEVVAVECGGKGTQQAVGYRDPANTREASPGEYRTYGRDSDGNVTSEIWQQNDGTIIIENGGATVTVSPDGVVSIDSDDVRIGTGAGKPVARVGDLIVGATPGLVCASPGSPCVAVPPTAVTPSGGYIVTGQIVSGSNGVKAGS